MAKHLTAPLTKEAAKALRAGETYLLSGTIYTARDAAHKRLCEAICRGEELPFDLKDAVIYYVGPTPEREGQVMGSAGPTTSGRMDAYSPTLIALGHRGMIGKGSRNGEVIAAMKEHGAVYFGAIGGCGALLGQCVKESTVIAYADLGAEAIRKLRVENMPVTVVIDSLGNDLYRLGREKFLMMENN